MDFNCFISVVSTRTELQRSGALRAGQPEDQLHKVGIIYLTTSCFYLKHLSDNVLILSRHIEQSLYQLMDSNI